VAVAGHRSLSLSGAGVEDTVKRRRLCGRAVMRAHALPAWLWTMARSCGGAILATAWPWRHERYAGWEPLLPARGEWRPPWAAVAAVSEVGHETGRRTRRRASGSSSGSVKGGGRRVRHLYERRQRRGEHREDVFALENVVVGSSCQARRVFVLQRAEAITRSKMNAKVCINTKMISGNLTCMKECEIRCASA
jgi:hypothetical protein